jgi:hypothetical protein
MINSPEKEKLRHPFSLWCLKGLLLLLSPSAIAPGVALMMDPSGRTVQFPEGYLAGSIFSDYFIPGLLLTVLIGFFSLTAWYVLWKKPINKTLGHLNPFPRIHWAWTVACCSGLALIIWIMVQVTMVPYFFLQPVLFTWGMMIILLCLMPSVRRYYQQ